MLRSTPIGSIRSQNASLIVVVFDARSAADWVPTKPAATKAQFSGSPAEVLRGLGKGEEFTTIDVGVSSGFAFELEGKSGQLEAYRLADGALALVAPPRAWWLESSQHGSHAIEIERMFDDAVGDHADTDADDATEIGELELESGKLAAVYLWHKKIAAARDLAAGMSSGGALAFGDGYGEHDGGLLVDLGAGRYRVVRRELTAPWDDTLVLVAMYFVPA